MTTFPTVTPRVVVEIKPIWFSKIFWTNVIGIAAMALSVFGGFEISAQTQLDIVAGIVAAQGAISILLKTFFTSTITPTSVPPNAMRE